MKRLIIQITKYLFYLVRKIVKTKKKRKDKVAIISFKLLGDTVFTIPAINYIKKNSPGKEIKIFCYPENKSIYKLYFDDVDYQTFNKQQVKFDTRKPNIFLTREIRKYKPNLLFDLSCEYISAVSSLFSGADELIGFNTFYFEGVFDTFSLKREDPHLFDMYLYPVLKYFGNDDKNVVKEFPSNFDSGEES